MTALGTAKGYISALVCTLAYASTARADEPTETIVVIGQDPDDRASARDRDRALGDAPFVTIVHADDHAATTSVADAIGATVGAQTRSLGGLGAYESVSIRGAAPGHTVVLIDGVPLARIAAVTTDLGRFSLDAFGEVELYRGAVPIELGGAGVGGALNLVTRLGRGDRGERMRISVGGGSFGARHVHVHYGDGHLDGRVLSSTTISYQGATGDYTYFSDGGTPLNGSDDRYELRRNNGFDQLDAATRIGAVNRSATGGLRIAWKHQGLPGSMAQPAYAASLATLDVIGDARGDVAVGSAIARELGFVLVEQQALRDPMGELGLGSQNRSYLTLSGGASSTWLAAFGRHRGTAGVELRADRFRDVDRSGVQPSQLGTRAGGAAMLAFDLAIDPAQTIVVTPAVRFDAVRTAPTPMTSGPSALAPIPPRWDVVPSPRISARAALREDLSIKGSAGYYVRLPTLVELFGNRGTILGSPELRAERGPSIDFGAVWAPARAIGGIDRILVETAIFATRARDTIALVSSAGFVARAMNVADSETYGGELVASARIVKAISITASYTRLATVQRAPEVSFDGKALPRRPDHAIYARAELAHRALGRRGAIWIDGSWQSVSYLDQANLQRVPARALAGTGLRVEVLPDLGVSVAVENVMDVRVEHLSLDPPPRPDLATIPTALSDVAGFPLPGRSFYLSLDWSY